MPDSISFSGSIPEVYDSNLGPLLFDPHAEDLSRRIKNEKIVSVLELACGTGRLTQYIRKKVTGAKIFATDINPDMLAVGKKKISDINIEWNAVDMQDIPFEDSSFDLVISQFGLMFVPDKVKAYKEIYRVLKPGGIFLFNTWDNLDNNKLAFTADAVINSFFQDNPILFYQIPFSYFMEDEIEQELIEGGFEDISFTRINYEGRSPSASHAAKGLVEGNPALISIRDRNPELVDVVRNELEKTLSERFGNNPMVCSMNAIVIETVKKILVE